MDSVQQKSVSMSPDAASGVRRERTMVDIFKDMGENIQGLIRGEVRLVKSEVREEIAKRTQPAKMILTGAVLGLFGAAYILLSGIYALSLVVPAWAAAGIVGLPLALIGVILINNGLNKL